MKLTLTMIATTGIWFTPGLHAQPEKGSTSEKTSAAAVPGVTGLSQALQRADLALARSGVAIKHIQGGFGEALADGYLSRGAEWAPLRQTIGRQGIDLLHVKVLPDGRIVDTMVSEVKTGGSQLNLTKSGRQMSTGWKAERLLKINDRYLNLRDALNTGLPVMERVPKGLSSKQLLDIPLGGGKHAAAWREHAAASWKIDTAGADMAQVKTQVGRLGEHLEAVAHGNKSHRSRILRLRFDPKNIHVTVKDASGLSLGTQESRLHVLHQFEIPSQTKNAVGSALQKAWEAELRRTQPFLADSEVKAQAKALTSKTLRHGFAESSRNRLVIASKQAATTGALAAFAIGGLDAAAQYWDTGSVDWKKTGAVALAGAGSAFAGTSAGYWTTHALLNTQSGLELTRSVANAMGLNSTSYTANLLGAASGASVAAVGLPYLLYFMGHTDITTANRMAVSGGFGVLAGTGAAWAATSLIATYGVAGTGTAIASLSGAAASSATAAWIGGGSVALGSALSWTGVGLIAVGAGVVVNWGFEAWDQSVEAERLKLTAQYLSEHYQTRN